MKYFPQFHDGSLDGLVIDKKNVHVLLATENREQFVLIASGVVTMAAHNFRQGNIIFEVAMRHHEEIALEAIEELRGLPKGLDRKDQARKLVEDTRQNLTLLEIIPSYGATCTLLAESIDLLPRNEWAERYLKAIAEEA